MRIGVHLTGATKRPTSGGLADDLLEVAIGSVPSPAEPFQDLIGRQILFLNWRDLEDPQAGGSEVFCWEMTRRFADAGADVTFMSAQPPRQGSRRSLQFMREGVLVRRAGGTFSVYLRVAAFLARRRGQFDAVVESQNGIPFFAPLFVSRRTAVVRVIHHVHQDQFRLRFGWPLSAVGRLLEARVARAVYRHQPIVVVSPSTRAGVRKQLGLRGPVYVVPNGLSVTDSPGPDVKRGLEPTIVVLGRLVKQKRLDLLLRSIALLRSRWPKLAVHIAGEGPWRIPLEALANELGLKSTVTFHGRVSADGKARLLDLAWLTVAASDAEGWGLTVLEANSRGVPTVARRVPGLADSVLDGETGWLVDTPGELTDGIERALRQLSVPSEAAAFSRRCRRWAARFSWHESAERLAAIVGHEIDTGAAPHRFDRLYSDLACLLEFTRIDAATFTTTAPTALRRTDVWRLEGDRVGILLHGCDEVDADRIALRIEVRNAVSHTARSQDRLFMSPGMAPTSPPGLTMPVAAST